MDFQPWKSILAFKESAIVLKQELPLPDYVVRLSEGVTQYETVLKSLWEDFKQNPNKTNARALVDYMKENSDKIWLETTLEVLGIEELSDRQEALLREELDRHHSFIEGSLYPDIIKGVEAQVRDFSNMDYRVIFLYAGALWSFGFLATVMFDGLDLRDLGDLFMFVGPNDEGTCQGAKGCKQHVGKIYTVLEILEKQIIPGYLACLTSCRHMLIPIVSSL